jgi:DNA-binding transcriptional regulator PaaX
MLNELENQIQKRARREKIQQKVLTMLFRFGTRSSRLAFAPEAALLKRLGLNHDEKWKPEYQIRQAVRRLHKKGLVQFQQRAFGWSVRLSSHGEKLAEKIHNAERIKIKKPEVWDKRWRIVIFDIWERRRGVRDKLRRALQKAGFYRVQHSVWVHPYDCGELISFLRADLKLGQGVLYIIADGIENDAKILEHFNLA